METKTKRAYGNILKTGVCPLCACETACGFKPLIGVYLVCDKFLPKLKKQGGCDLVQRN